MLATPTTQLAQCPRPTRKTVKSDRDQELGAEVQAALCASGYGSLKCISSRVTNGMVLLRGSVGSWYLKQVAQEVVMHITGRGYVRNELLVVSRMVK